MLRSTEHNGLRLSSRNVAVASLIEATDLRPLYTRLACRAGGGASRVRGSLLRRGERREE
jgi:hypothetical protein